MTLTTALSEVLTLYETEVLTARNLAIRSRRGYLNNLQDLIVYLQKVSGIFDPA